MKRVLDFSLVADTGTPMEYSEELRSRLTTMPETLERANSAVMFAQQAAKQSEPWISAAFLRASLADLCAMEEMQKFDRPTSLPVKVADERNPLLHLLVLLRLLNIHVKAMAVAPEHSVISFNGMPLALDDQPLTWSVLVVTNLSSSDLAALRDGAKYDLSDLERCVTWFSDRQRSGGVGGLVVQGVAIFAKQLCDRHNP